MAENLEERVKTLEEDRATLIHLFHRLGFDAEQYIDEQRNGDDDFHTMPAYSGLKLIVQFDDDHPFSEQGLEWAKSFLQGFFKKRGDQSR
jgi:hypothetical protein